MASNLAQQLIGYLISNAGNIANGVASATKALSSATGGAQPTAGAVTSNQQLAPVPVTAATPQAAYNTAVKVAGTTPAPTVTTSYGVSYNPDVDYKARMDAYAAAGQYAAAAEAERSRNAKLVAMGRGNETTSIYYDSANIGGVGSKSTSVDLASAQYGGTNPYYPVVSGSDAARWQQAAAGGVTTGGAQAGQTGQTGQQTAAQQVLSAYLAQGGAGLGTANANANALMSQMANYPDFGYPAQPTWYDQYGTMYNKALSEVVNRAPFSYSKEGDPSYAAYAKQYLMEGDRATENAIARSAAMSGGIPSTAATAAGTQAGDYYSAQLSAKIPELFQQAYQRYVDEFNMDREALSDVSGARASDYGVYRDNVGDYQTNRQFSYSDYLNQYDMLQSNLNNYINADNTAYNRAYTASRDAVADSRYDTEWTYGVAQTAAAQEAAAKAEAEKTRQQLFDNALTLVDAGLTSEQIAAAIGNGVTKAQIDAIIAGAKATGAKSSGAGGNKVNVDENGNNDNAGDTDNYANAKKAIIAAMNAVSAYGSDADMKYAAKMELARWELSLTDAEYVKLVNTYGLSY
ncbi:MAG: hypothetical protein LBC21_02015 [Oscillospiraceae bacterium]|jgi:hypothetical protein|nr:hypothetical protein [Oscillospiraceae bacterium]